MPAIHVSRSIVIDAPVERVYSVVRDFKQWPTWSPWIIAEPDCKLTFADDGSHYEWDGNIIGSGGLTIMGEEENSRIDYDLNFIKPWKSQADVTFSFEGNGDSTSVNWKMDSSLPVFMFFMKNMMTAMIGCDYDRGLTMLKAYIETGSIPSKLEFGQRSNEAFQIVGIRTTCPMDDVGTSMKGIMEKLGSFLAESNCEPSGNPISMYHKWDPVKETTEYTLGFPVNSAPASLPDGFALVEIPAHEAYTVTHTGPYPHLGNAWSSGMMRGRAKVFKQSKVCDPFEVYENDPESTPAEELVTVVNLPMK